MNKSSRWIAASIAIVIASIATAGAQEFPTPPSPPARAPVEEQAPPAAVTPGTETPRAAPPAARTAVRGTAIEGTWTGAVTQVAGGAAGRNVGGQAKYPVIVTISGKTAETDYPDQACGGKLNRIGQSRNYVFFVEVISRGGVDQGGRCPNGAITLTRTGEKLGLEWFGVFEGELVVALGTLTRKAAQ